jgi:hypothetical protein
LYQRNGRRGEVRQQLLRIRHRLVVPGDRGRAVAGLVELADVGPGHEGPGTRAGQRQHPDCGAVEFTQRCSQLQPHVQRHCVAPFGMADRQGCNAVLEIHLDLAVAHTTPSSYRRSMSSAA